MLFHTSGRQFLNRILAISATFLSKTIILLKELWLLISNMTWGIFLNFQSTTQKSKNFILMGYFCPKSIRFELKKYRRIIFHETEQWCKIWINPDHLVLKIACGIEWTFIRALKVWKIVYWWALFARSI